jgi:hypothetical protein
MTLTTRHLALATASLFAVTAAIDIPHEQAQPFASTLDYVLEAVFALSLAAGAATLFSLLRGARGWAARIGFGLSGLGTATVAFVAGATHVNGHDVLGPVFGIGLLATGLGYLVLAVGDLARKVQPRFAGLVLLGSMVAMILLGEGYGVIAWSAGWFAVGALLSPAPVPARAREVMAG